MRIPQCHEKSVKSFWSTVYPLAGLHHRQVAKDWSSVDVATAKVTKRSFRLHVVLIILKWKLLKNSYIMPRCHLGNFEALIRVFHSFLADTTIIWKVLSGLAYKVTWFESSGRSRSSVRKTGEFIGKVLNLAGMMFKYFASIPPSLCLASSVRLLVLLIR